MYIRAVCIIRKNKSKTIAQLREKQTNKRDGLNASSPLNAASERKAERCGKSV